MNFSYKYDCKQLKSQLKDTSFEEQINSFDKNQFGYTSLTDFLYSNMVGRYKLTKPLGTGSFSKVFLGEHGRDSVAIKIISKYSDVVNKDGYEKKEERVLREILISSLTNHPNIVRLIDFMFNEYYYFMIFEPVIGHQLLDLISQKGALSEAAARRYFNQILSSIDYLHSNSIVHRDLKIENILVDKHDNIKIIDFGLSNFYDKKELLNTFCGSLYFAAPELLTGTEYCGPEVDIWALGVILFVLVCGKVPFDDKDLKVLHKKIKQAELRFNKKSLSRPLVRLLKRIIVNDPKKRMGLAEIMKDPWLITETSDSSTNSSQDTSSGFYSSSKSSDACNKTIRSCVSDKNLFINHNKYNENKNIREINNDLLNLMFAVTKFQFPDFKKEVIAYSKICKDDTNRERLFWNYSPSVSLYCMLENSFNDTLPDVGSLYNNNAISSNTTHCTKGCNTQTSDNSITQIDNLTNGGKEENMSKFVKLLFSKHTNCFFNKDSEDSEDKCTVHSNLRKRVIGFFKEENIDFETKEKSYICISEKVKFNVSLFCNKRISKHFLTIKKVKGNDDNFKSIVERIKESLVF
ncbi:putative serine/threonine-protein kinase KIN1 like protein [Cucumispora dikerogammari]|nr:putative serine/threonine-protein kinase KIN1 like protein [Cucumispora dikerogammari]